MLYIILSKYYHLNLSGSLGAFVSLLISFSSSENFVSDSCYSGLVCYGLPCPDLFSCKLGTICLRLFISVGPLRDQNHLSVELDAILSFIFQSNIHNCSFKYWGWRSFAELNRPRVRMLKLKFLLPKFKWLSNKSPGRDLARPPISWLGPTDLIKLSPNMSGLSICNVFSEHLRSQTGIPTW